MKQVRSNTTRIKNLVMEKLPDEQDIFGYAGINKSLLVQVIGECFGLIDGIEEKKETFDVIILKREFQPLSKSCLDYLNSLPNEKQAGDFDVFLKNLSKIRTEINNAYLLFVKESLRPESELATIRTALAEIVPSNQELITQQGEATRLIKEIGDSHKDIQDKQVHVQSLTDAVEEAHTSANSSAQQIKASHEAVTGWEESIEAAETEIAKQTKQITEHETRIKALQEEIGRQTELFDALSKKLTDQLVKNDGFQKEIRNTIDDANRASMAGSFKKRKDELDAPLNAAEKNLVLVLLLFGAASLYVLTASMGTGGINLAQLSGKLPILTPFVWLAWVFTNKVGHLSRIREDYSFKYAAAMAYEGYKRNCEEGDDLSRRLLELSIENMGANPTRLYGNHQSGPIHEMLGKGKDMVDSIVSSVKNKQ